MNTYWAFVRTSTQPGAGVFKVTMQSDTPFNAYSAMKAMYGSLLFSAFATPV